ncbi:hypothetical protein AMTR_s00010p00197060 [Amborella trichopoda]|uniref:Uncharacterized protein n=1 Tax=Amborella trichopoda TaxID=13333 RepID=W1NGD4_AMBTC|nr:hypothetical protein AMTR_s00010p00197060 [Amborella trichopoda]
MHRTFAAAFLIALAEIHGTQIPAVPFWKVAHKRRERGARVPPKAQGLPIITPPTLPSLNQMENLGDGVAKSLVDPVAEEGANDMRISVQKMGGLRKKGQETMLVQKGIKVLRGD